jgi:hypothetical protein
LQGGVGADAVFGEEGVELFEAGEGVAVEGEEDVAEDEAGLGGGGVGLEADEDEADGLAELLGEGFGQADGMGADAEEAEATRCRVEAGTTMPRRCRRPELAMPSASPEASTTTLPEKPRSRATSSSM